MHVFVVINIGMDSIISGLSGLLTVLLLSKLASHLSMLVMLNSPYIGFIRYKDCWVDVILSNINLKISASRILPAVRPISWGCSVKSS